MVRTAILAVAFASTLAVAAAAGPFEDGKAAFERGDHQTALYLLRPLAEQGNKEASALLAQGYSFGDGGFPEDPAQGQRWRRLAAEQGHAYSQFLLGERLREEGAYGEALQWFRRAASHETRELGTPQAQLYLGYHYRDGQGVTQDYAEAAKWFRLSAVPGGLEELGDLYRTGRGVPKDLAQAASLYRQGAEINLPSQQYKLGQMYREGEGVPQDLVEALMWFTLAAKTYASPSFSSRERSDTIEALEQTAKVMTRAQILEAERRAREWKPAWER